MSRQMNQANGNNRRTIRTTIQGRNRKSQDRPYELTVSCNSQFYDQMSVLGALKLP
jgi:hypothetical protein